MYIFFFIKIDTNIEDYFNNVALPLITPDC